MKRIATLTTHAADNYGAVLQAYALQHYLEMSGYTCDILNYVPQYTVKDYRIVKRPSTLRDAVLSLFQLMHYRERKERKQRFIEFRNDYLKLSGKVIKAHEDLINAANEYGMIICGSDQIWNPRIHDFDEAYFLSFDDVKAKRVSYAASFGQDNIEGAIIPELARRLKGFSSFACREHSAIQLIQELTGKNADFVMDPVFLLSKEDWKKITNPAQLSKKYDLVYFLSNPGLSPYAVKEHAKSKGNKVLSIGFSPRDYKYGIECDYSIGPLEFLGAIDNADVILTNSFHCTAFSILLEKDFYVRLQKGKQSRNGRIVSLLSELGLTDRIYYDEDAKKLDFSKRIDYTPVQRKLEALVRESKEYLIKVLEE